MATSNSSSKSKLKLNKPKVASFEDALSGLRDYGYSQDDLKIIKDAYDLIKGKGKTKWKLIRPILPIEEWLESDYHIGSMKYDIFPFWKRHVINIFNSKTKINQVVLTGAIGTGKSTVGALLLIRKLYELSCYENVSALFELSSISRIALAYLSVTKDQAAITGFASIQEWIDSIPYFQEEFPRQKGLDSMLVWPNEKLFLMAGSTTNHFIGTDLIAGILDEANFFEGKPREEGEALATKVFSLYTNMRNRGASRFLVNGVHEYLSVLVSSSTHASSFTEQTINKHIDDPHTYIISPAQWEVRPEKFSKERFPVYVGGNGVDAQVIKTIDDYNIILSTTGFTTIPHDVNIIDAYEMLPQEIKSMILMVPKDLYSNFVGDVVTGLQDFAGFSSSASGRFFTNYGAYSSVVKKEIQHPFTHEEIILSTTKSPLQDGFLGIETYFRKDFKLSKPEALRYVHLDLSKTGDCTGISMSHIHDWKVLYTKTETEVDVFGMSSDVVVQEVKAPIIRTDFMLRVVPPKKPEEISYAKILKFFIYLKNTLGVKFGLITADQAFSAQLMQELNELDFPTGYLSVDRDTKAYGTLAELIFDNRLEIYDYAPFREELFSLVRYRNGKTTKIDHPKAKGASKDVSDSLAGSVYNAVSSKDKTDVTNTDMLDLYININKNISQDKQDILKKLTKMLNGY